MSSARVWWPWALVLALVSAGSAVAEGLCERIVTLSPSVTEIVYDLGLGERLVGVTEFCRYPPEALGVPRVGGYLDLNVERIVTSRATTVFGLFENQPQVRPLERFPVTVDLLDHSSLAGIKASYTTIAKRCGVEDRARARLSELARREEALAQRCAARSNAGSPLRIMVVVGRTREGSVHTGVYLSGRDGFYGDILTLLGAVNVYRGRTVAVPTLSVEGIRALQPDVIIDVVNIDDGGHTEQFKRYWRRFPSLPAVRNGGVLVVSDDYASIPGPRYILLAEKIAQVVCASGGRGGRAGHIENLPDVR